MSSLTLNNMQNSQRKTQINTYGNKDKYPPWKARRRAAGLPSARSLLGGDQTGLGLTPELVCPFPAPISDASSARHVVSSSLPDELRAREHPDVCAFCTSGEGGSWRGKALAIPSLSISQRESCQQSPARANNREILSALIGPRIDCDFQDCSSPFRQPRFTHRMPQGQNQGWDKEPRASQGPTLHSQDLESECVRKCALWPPVRVSPTVSAPRYLPG